MNILILNLHSAKNLGDDAIMLQTLRGLRQRYPGARITAAANDPASWEKHTGLRVVPSVTAWTLAPETHGWKFDYDRVLSTLARLALSAVSRRWFGRRPLTGSPAQRQTLQAYDEADLVLSCGGGNFYSQHNFSLPLILSLITLLYAVWLGKPVYMLPQSIGPLHGPLLRNLSRHTFQRARQIWVREELSALLLAEIGVTRPAKIMPDLAFGLPPVQPSGPLGHPQLRIGLTLMDRGKQHSAFAGQAAYEDALFGGLCEAARRYGAELTVFAQCFGPSPDQDDRPAAHRFYTRLREAGVPARLLDSLEQVDALRGELARMDLVVGTRMHTGILAFTCGVPTILIAYQPKAAGTLALLGMSELCLPIEQISAGELLDRIQRVLAQPDGYRAHLAGRMDALRAQLSAWPDALPDPESLHG